MLKMGVKNKIKKSLTQGYTLELKQELKNGKGLSY